MKRFLLSIFAGVLALSVLTACGEIQQDNSPSEDQSEEEAEE